MTHAYRYHAVSRRALALGSRNGQMLTQNRTLANATTERARERVPGDRQVNILVQRIQPGLAPRG